MYCSTANEQYRPPAPAACEWHSATGAFWRFEEGSMVHHGVLRTGLAALATLAAVGCGSQPDQSPDESRAVSWETRGGIYLHGQARDTRSKEARVFSAPPGAHLTYFGGRIV